MNNKYLNGKIYELFDEDDLDAPRYYGSTCDTIEERKSGHKADYKRFLEGKKNYITSFEIIKRNNWDIKLIEMFSCETKTELEKREG